MATVKVGMIGAGAIARSHVGSINSHANGEVIAIADPAAERAQALADEHGVGRVYADAETLIADPDVEAVSIGVPNKFHAPYAEAAPSGP